MKSSLLLAASLVAAATVAQAHDIWITIDKTAGECRAIVNYGHPQDRPPALADKIVDFALQDGEKRVSLMDGLAQTQTGAAITVASKPFDCGHALLAVHYENGFWIKNSKRQLSQRDQAVGSRRSGQHVVGQVCEGDHWPRSALVRRNGISARNRASSRSCCQEAR